MRYSNIYIPTVKDAMQDTEALNYRLLHKAGYLRRSSAGIYSLLQLGMRTRQNLINFIGSRLEQSNCFEIHLSKGAAKEELIKALTAGRISYKELPIGSWYVEENLREGIRPRLGLFQPKAWERLEGFKLLDGMVSLKDSAQEIADIFEGIFEDLKLDIAEAKQISSACSEEWDRVMFLPYVGGTEVFAICTGCGAITAVDSMECTLKENDGEAVDELSMEYTPEVKTIADVAKYLKTEPVNIVKTLIYNADGKLYGVLLRGDRELSERKLKQLLKCKNLRAADEKEVYASTGAGIGFAGPVGLKAEIICDYEAAAVRNIIVGANKTDHHYINAVFGRDFNADIIADVRNCSADDKCPKCNGEIKLMEGFVLADVRMQEVQHSEAQRLVYINDQGREDSLHILSYQFYLYPLLAALVEKYNDKDGLIWPDFLAPFEVVVMAVHEDNEAQTAAAGEIYNTLKAMNYNVLLDDRTDRVSIKFKDSELMGIPLRITAGRKISEGIIEVKHRTGEMCEIQLKDLIEYILE